jgi:hypothetical protein
LQFLKRDRPGKQLEKGIMALDSRMPSPMACLGDEGLHLLVAFHAFPVLYFGIVRHWASRSIVIEAAPPPDAIGFPDSGFDAGAVEVVEAIELAVYDMLCGERQCH